MGPSKSQSKCSTNRIKNCLRNFLAHLFSHIGLCVLIVSYAIFGAALFERLESGYEMEQWEHKSKNWTTTFTQIRQQYVDELWNITEQFNILYELNWTAAVEQELRNFEAIVAYAARQGGYDTGSGRELERQWSFSGALLYSVSIITTIGYGNTAPRTASGKILTMLYAVIGVPLMLLWLSNIGTLMANTFKFAYSYSSCPSYPSGTYVKTSRKAVQNRTESMESVPSLSKVKYSVGEMQCKTRVLQDHSQHPQLERPALKQREQRNTLKHLDTAAKKVLLECAEYNLSVERDERSRRVIEQIKSAESTIDEISSDDDNVIDISIARLTAGRDRNLMNEWMNKEKPGASASSGVEEIRGERIEGTPSKIPLLQESGTLMDVEVGYLPVVPVRHIARLDPKPRVPILLVLIFVVVYILVGATVFSMWEDWNFLESAYFCFITLSTIGLGDYVPGRSLHSDGSKEGHAQLIVCCLYLVLGLAIIAMSFNLVQEEVAAKVKSLAKRIGIIKNADY